MALRKGVSYVLSSANPGYRHANIYCHCKGLTMFYAILERETGKSHIVECNNEAALKCYNSEKYAIVPVDPPISTKDRRFNGRINESIDPLETLKPAERKYAKVRIFTDYTIIEG